MSDRTYAQVIVYDCPKDQRAAALAAIFEAFDSDRINERPEGDALVLGDRYGDDQCAGDLSETIADAMIEAAPGATFRAWTDPAYDWLGSLVMYAPDLGSYAHDCDANGQARFSAREIVSILDNPDDRVGPLFGLTWDATIEAARARLTGTEPVPIG